MQWDVKVSIGVFMSEDTNEPLLECVISCASLSGVVVCVAVCVCVFEWRGQWLDHCLLECIFAFSLMDANNTFKVPSVEHTCDTTI